MKLRSLLIPALSLTLLSGFTGCSNAGSNAGPGAATTAPTLSVPAKNTKEVQLVSAVRPNLVNLDEALKRNDIPAAKAAYTQYDAAWNGIEVYINFRSRQLYGELEQDLQAKIEKALDEPQPNAAQIRPLVESMLKKYDEAIKLSQTGPAISPIFDDVAAIRIVRSNLRLVGPALKANDVAGAKESYAAFQSGWPGVRGLIQARSIDAAQEIDGMVASTSGAFDQNKPAVELASATDALMTRYNYGLSLVNVAARNADLSKSGATGEDIKQTLALGTMEAHLRAAQPLWEAGDYAGASKHAAIVAELFGTVSDPLKAKGADPDLKKALDAYNTLASQAGDSAKARAANRMAIEAVRVAEQALTGQFWTDAKFQGSLVRGLVTNVSGDYGRPAGQSVDPTRAVPGFQTAWGLLVVADKQYQQIDQAVKTASPAQADTIAKQFQMLKTSLPNAVKQPSPPADPQAVATAATALSAALESALGLPKS